MVVKSKEMKYDKVIIIHKVLVQLKIHLQEIMIIFLVYFSRKEKEYTFTIYVYIYRPDNTGEHG